MPKSSIQKLLTVVLVLNFVISAGCAQISREQDPQAEIGFIDINSDMQAQKNDCSQFETERRCAFPAWLS